MPNQSTAEAQPEVVVRLELNSQIALPGGSTGTIGRALIHGIEAALDRLLLQLGLPGRGRLMMEVIDSALTPVRWYVHDAPIDYPDELAASVWAFISGRVSMPKSSGWQQELESCVQEHTPTDTDAIAKFFQLLLIAVIEQQPSALISPKQVHVYARRLVEAGLPVEDSNPNNWLESILRHVLDLRMSLVDTRSVAETLHRGRTEQRSVTDIAESLVTALASEVLEIHAPIALVRQFSMADVEDRELVPLMREGLYYDIGVRYPALRFVASDDLPAGAFAFKVNDWMTTPCMGVGTDRCLVNETVERLTLFDIKGDRAINPANGTQCSIIAATDVGAAKKEGLTTWDQYSYLVLCMAAELRHRAFCFINTGSVQWDLAKAFPELLSQIHSQFGLEKITRVLRSLAAEEISVRNLRTILERLLTFDYVPCDSSQLIIFDDRMPVNKPPTVESLQDPTTWTAFVRTGLKRYISHKYSRGGNTLVVYLVDTDIEGIITAHINTSTPVAEADAQRIAAAVEAVVGNLSFSSQTPVLLTTIGVRASLRKLIERRFPRLPVLCYQELAPDMNIQPTARITL